MKYSDYIRSGSRDLLQRLKDDIKESVESNMPNDIEKLDILTSMEKHKDELSTAKKKLSFGSDMESWIYATFGTEISSKREIEYPIIKGEWGQSKALKSSEIEIRNLIFQNEENINYKLVNLRIKAAISLNSGQFWVFLRANNKFTKNIPVVFVDKEEGSDRINLNLGTFLEVYENNVKKLYFHVFCKEQIVKDYKVQNTSSNIGNAEHETERIKLIIEDDGSDTIRASAKFYNGKVDNDIKGSFFMPYNHHKETDDMSNGSNIMSSHKVMIAGTGVKCQINSFIIETYFKDDFKMLDLEKDISADAECCLIN